MWYAMVFRVQHAVVDVVAAQIMKFSHNGPEICSAAASLQAGHVLQHEHPGLVFIDVVQYVKENQTTAASVTESLL